MASLFFNSNNCSLSVLAKNWKLAALHATGRNRYNLFATGRSRMQILHALAASTVQSRQFFASTLGEQLVELKNEDAIKKSENLRDTCAC
jgi:hypothetical protein